MPDPKMIFQLLNETVASESSDLHLVVGYPPTVRTHGQLRPLGADGLSDGALSGEAVSGMIRAIVSETQWEALQATRNLDCSVETVTGSRVDRFRLNAFFAQRELAACLRHIPGEIPSFAWMGFPTDLAERFLAMRQGLVILTGITGSGKTTTLAGLVREMGQNQNRRIITVEQPIEYVYPPMGSSLITQREVGVDVASFYDGLVYGLRQDPDVILVGEIRDRETAQMALSAAETGHLIFSTLHTQDAKGAITRFIDLFPYEIQDDIRTQLGLSLKYVVCQHLVPSARAGQKRVLAMEVLNVTHAVRSAIRNGKIEAIESVIQTGRKDGMVALDESLASLAGRGEITWETATEYAKDPKAIGDYISVRRHD